MHSSLIFFYSLLSEEENDTIEIHCKKKNAVFFSVFYVLIFQAPIL